LYFSDHGAAGIAGEKESINTVGLRFYTEYGYNAESEKMRIRSDGAVGIGTTDPGVYKLNIAGTGYLGASAWVYSSDQRLKENISYLENNSGVSGSLDKILQLKPARFDYIAGEKNNLGFIAQDVQPVIPEAVVVANQTTGMLGLKTDFILPYLVGAIQEQQGQIDNLKLQLDGNGLLNSTSTLAALQSNSGWLDAIKNAIVTLFQSGIDGIKNFAADKITSKQSVTDQLCVKDSGNNDICLTGDQLKDLIDKAGSSVTINQTFTSPVNDATTTTDGSDVAQ
jgi:hypothetical protein